MADEPTREELLAYYKAHTQQVENRSSDPQQAQRDVINQKPLATYKEMRSEWNKRRGILQHDATFDTGMTTDEEKPYQKLREQWYSRQGKKDPIKRKAELDNSHQRYAENR